jgi:16S rRNA (guanine966-N2)-methyltransferase
MRITGGALARRPIDAPKGDRTRPTTDRVREALFSALGSRMDLRGARVLDLFAGSGALGLEAVSRGAARATLVERHGPTLAVARGNARQLGVADRVRTVRADALVHLGAVAEEAGPFDLVFADPPYDLAEIPALPGRVRPLLAPGGLFALEHDARHDFAEADGLVFSRAYGRTVVSVFEG